MLGPEPTQRIFLALPRMIVRSNLCLFGHARQPVSQGLRVQGHHHWHQLQGCQQNLCFFQSHGCHWNQNNPCSQVCQGHKKLNIPHSDQWRAAHSFNCHLSRKQANGGRKKHFSQTVKVSKPSCSRDAGAKADNVDWQHLENIDIGLAVS